MLSTSICNLDDCGYQSTFTNQVVGCQYFPPGPP